MVVVRVHSVVRKRSGGGGYTPTVSLPSEVYKAWGEPKAVLVTVVAGYPGRPVLLVRPARTVVSVEWVKDRPAHAELAQLLGAAREKVRGEPGQVQEILAAHIAVYGESSVVAVTPDAVATDTGLRIEFATPEHDVARLAGEIVYLYTGDLPVIMKDGIPAAAKIVVAGDKVRVLLYTHA